MPDYNVVFEIDAHGTRVDHRVTATTDWMAVLIAQKERRDAGKAGHVVDCQEIPAPPKFKIGDKVRIARASENDPWLDFMEDHIGFEGVITELPSDDDEPGYLVPTNHPDDEYSGGYYYPEDCLELVEEVA
jgi:hypothetical protein